MAALKLIKEVLLAEQKITIRQIKYFNNIIEQDHRPVKRITRLIRGFKSFLSAAAMLVVIELQHMLKFKGNIY